MRLVLLGFAVVCCLGYSARVDVKFDELPGRYLGRLDVAAGHCSATLVGPSVIATAAHCFEVGEGKNMKLSTDGAVFKLNFTRGDYKADAKITEIIVGENYEKLPTPLRGNDWAIGFLDKPLGVQFGWLPLSHIGLPVNVKLNVSGYSSDYNGGRHPGIDSDCKLLDPNGGTAQLLRKAGLPIDNYYLHDCKAAPGASGGPTVGDVSFNQGNKKIPVTMVAAVNTNGDKINGNGVSITMRDAFPIWIRTVTIQMIDELAVHAKENPSMKLSEPFARMTKDWSRATAKEKKDLLAKEFRTTDQVMLGWANVQDALASVPRSELKYRIGIDVTQYAPIRIVKVAAGSPADRAGIKVGDVVEKVDFTEWPNAAMLRENLNKSAGISVSLKISRDGKVTEYSVRPERVEK